MKIVYLSDSIIPSRTANSIHVMKMCQAFSKIGHEVFLIVPDIKQTEPGVDNIYQYYGVDVCFKIIKLPWFAFKGRSYIYGLLAAIKAQRLHPDLVYSRFIPGCYFRSVLGSPVVFESHTPVKNSGRISEWMFSKLILRKKFKQLVVISNALRSYYLQEYGISKEFITVASDSADNCKYDGPTIFKSDRLQAGYVGHLYPGRGIDIISELAKNCPWADFHLVGGTEPDVKYWKNKLKKSNNVIFHGFIPHSQTDIYRKSFDVLLAPYQQKVSIHGGRGETAQWMSPLKIFEYMAAGKAILCSDLPVLREVLTHEKTALLCEPEEYGSWIIALKRLRDDEVLRKRLGETAKKEFEIKYTWKARASNILNNLSEIKQ